MGGVGEASLRETRGPTRRQQEMKKGVVRRVSRGQEREILGMHMQREFQEVIKCSESLDMMEKQETVAFNNLHHISSGQYNRRIRFIFRGVKRQGAARQERG